MYQLYIKTNLNIKNMFYQCTNNILKVRLTFIDPNKKRLIDKKIFRNLLIL